MKTINSLRSKLLALTLALMASVSSFAYDFQVDGLNYTITSSVDPYTVEVTKNISDNGNNYEGYTSITIPKSVLHNGVKYQVTGIGKEAFLYTSVSEFTIPETVKYIAESAFGGSFELTSIEIPNSVTDIGSAAFTSSDKLTSVILGDGVTTIGPLAFMGCRALQTINIPESVTAISALAFYDCPKITDVKLNNGLVEIKDQAFSYTNITSIEIPKSVTILGLNPFSYIPSLTKLSVKKGHPLFNSDPNSNAIIETATNTLVAGCRYSIVPNTITAVGKAAFMGCKGRTELSLPNSVKTINDSAYFGCIDLKSIDIPNSVTTIGSEVFSWCASATSLTIGENVNSIGGRAFWGCEKIKTVTCNAIVVPNLGEDVFDYMFDGNIHLATLYVPAESVEAYKTAAQWKDFGQILPIEPTTSYKSQWCDQWNILSHGYQGPQDPLAAACTSIFWLSNNTVNRDGQEYIPLMCSSSRPDVESTNLIGELRFTEDKQVYFYYDNTEYLLYDFDVQVGDTLDIFGGIELYSYSFVEQKTYPHVITKIDTLDDGRLQITSDAIVIFEDGEVGTFEEKQQQIWIEGLGSTNGIVYTSINPGIAGDVAIVMLCAYRDDECVYKTDSNDPYWIDYTQLGCVYNEGDFIEGAFPILSGLQRTVYDEFCGEAEIGAVYTGKQTFDKIFFENNKPYILCNDYLLREEDNKILIYSQLLNKDLVLYDFTLEVGDSLPALYIDYHARNARNAMDWMPYNPDVVDYNIDFDGTIYPADTFVVTDISNVTLLDGKEYKKWTFDNGMEYVEGIGMYGGRRNGNFFGLIQEVVVPCHIGTHLVCVSKNGKLLYQMDDAEMERLGTACLCEAETPEDLFPTLWGLQQTICSGYYGEEGDEWASGLTGPSQEITMMDGKPYLQWGSWYLREENDKILVYSEIQKKDLVLYDFTLELGDTLTTLNLVTPEFLEYEGIVGIVDYPLSDYDYTYPIDTLVVTELSKETLLDGKEYTRWKFSDGTVYVEGIGSMSETFFHHIADHLPVPVSYLGSYLVCVSKNNKLLYQMDPVKMDELGAECLCDYNRGPRKDNAKDGQIGGRPTPTQWNQLEVVLRQMDNNHTILQAETFSYTLEDISQQVNNKTYFQLARQSTKDTATTKSVVGALHFGKDEDNRVYFLRDGVEYVLYDFTAEIGDTVEIFAGINNYPQETTYTHVVVDKDTTEDGACRMFLEVVFPEETTTAENAEKVWLAGLGSIDGIVHNAAKRTNNAHAAPSRSASSSETESSVMLCAWREDSCLYTTNHPDYETFGCVYNQEPTSVEDISTSQSSYQKIIREGQFLILHNGKTYSIMGIEL
ncbi:MAG: leucine-rich repeat domain-containing protein [Paludibacteraceae bacterium]|nr:leucine-rich repeat domain-containing protein [Paludibacteraceae bacterium]